MVFEFLYSDLTVKMIYGFGFMFVTLFIASLSDIRRMLIKKSFMYMWVAFTALILISEYLSQINWFKWVLIAAFGLLTWRGIGKIFSLARADVAAIMAVSSILAIPQILLFYLILFLINKVVVFIAVVFKKNRYPFIPVVWLSLVILIFLLGVINWNLMEILSILPFF